VFRVENLLQSVRKIQIVELRAGVVKERKEGKGGFKFALGENPNFTIEIEEQLERGQGQLAGSTRWDGQVKS